MQIFLKFPGKTRKYRFSYQKKRLESVGAGLASALFNISGQTQGLALFNISGQTQGLPYSTFPGRRKAWPYSTFPGRRKACPYDDLRPAHLISSTPNSCAIFRESTNK
ncbi:hypothetical protein Runsl_3139 [Runella slithyformis DSM 19594]|uniref:Uncharacterized protein n=1 Tax=Runella slithyformis (strain ATCC 29530 / DSM 19594 / LMG 11500 / NCIMB 11436 / LSU 4) TaxID=761193 RepID=A0A7U3ZLP7_RUNSL|nr:hypothetical protein Runsl_3139 [Runella slithyformis DSM 19594]